MTTWRFVNALSLRNYAETMIIIARSSYRRTSRGARDADFPTEAIYLGTFTEYKPGIYGGN